MLLRAGTWRSYSGCGPRAARGPGLLATTPLTEAAWRCCAGPERLGYTDDFGNLVDWYGNPVQ